jgi:hypothetical protein
MNGLVEWVGQDAGHGSNSRGMGWSCDWMMEHSMLAQDNATIEGSVCLVDRDHSIDVDRSKKKASTTGTV